MFFQQNRGQPLRRDQPLKPALHVDYGQARLGSLRRKPCRVLLINARSHHRPIS